MTWERQGGSGDGDGALEEVEGVLTEAVALDRSEMSFLL